MSSSKYGQSSPYRPSSSYGPSDSKPVFNRQTKQTNYLEEVIRSENDQLYDGITDRINSRNSMVIDRIDRLERDGLNKKKLEEILNKESDSPSEMGVNQTIKNTGDEVIMVIKSELGSIKKDVEHLNRIRVDFTI